MDTVCVLEDEECLLGVYVCRLALASVPRSSPDSTLLSPVLPGGGGAGQLEEGSMPREPWSAHLPEPLPEPRSFHTQNAFTMASWSWLLWPVGLRSQQVLPEQPPPSLSPSQEAMCWTKTTLQ